MTLSPVKSRNSSAHAGAGAAPVATPRAKAAARAELAKISRRVVQTMLLLLLLLVVLVLEASSSLPLGAATAASAVFGQATREFELTEGDTDEKASADPADRRAQSAAAVSTDLWLAPAILKLAAWAKNDLANSGGACVVR